MNEINLEELKAIQVEILDEVHRFCEANGIKYFLSSGTLIGAVRHKGYIPWDDDIDLYMLRSDYEDFLKEFNKKEENYRVVSLRTDKKCTIAYAKVERLGTVLIEDVDHPMEQGVNIDIFPVDGVPDDVNARKKYFSRIDRYRNMMTLKNVSLRKSRSLIKNAILLFGKFSLFPYNMRLWPSCPARSWIPGKNPW